MSRKNVAVLLLMSFLSGTLYPAARGPVPQTQQPASEGLLITPAGSLIIDAGTKRPAVAALPLNFVRSPDQNGPGQQGRYLVSINSGYGVQFNSVTNRAQQSLSVIDLTLTPPQVIQNVYFPSPQSANVGAAFSPKLDASGHGTLFVSGGFENKIWMFGFDPIAAEPITPGSPGPNTTVQAPFIDLSSLASGPATPLYNKGQAPVYPAGLALVPTVDTLLVANNLGDSLGVVSSINGTRKLTRIDLRGADKDEFIYPYQVVVLPERSASTYRVFISCWGSGSVMMLDGVAPTSRPRSIPVGRHPTAMLLNRSGSRLYVANSDGDSVSVIDTGEPRELERISVRLVENGPPGNSPEGLALSSDENTLYVANAHSNSVAVITLSAESSGSRSSSIPAGPNAAHYNTDTDDDDDFAAPPADSAAASTVRGFIPTGQYPSAIAVVDHDLIIANGKGTGFENSSQIVNGSGREPNTPNAAFPPGAGRGEGAGGQYSLSLVSGNISFLPEPDGAALARYTRQVMQDLGLGLPHAQLFQGKSPISHVIYVIKENRTYDQVLGDIKQTGDGSSADGDPDLAIFGSGAAAQLQSASGSRSRDGQSITPNQHALALRFGLMDRFFVNSEASPDGHNWSTAAFSNDYVDKAYRWDYSGRGRSYDYEGFNRLPDLVIFKYALSFSPGKAATADSMSSYMQRFLPYLNGSRDIAEPETLYLWDAAARAGLSYRSYGEYIPTFSQADLTEVNTARRKTYPDISPTVSAFAAKKTLEHHFNSSSRNFDLYTPDSITTDSYRRARAPGVRIDPLISADNAERELRGNSRLGTWLEEFNSYVADVKAGRPDRMPNLSIVRLSNDHTSGLAPAMPTPQFYVADNDYAVGRLVEAVSRSPYWKNTAIVTVEDDAQDGPDHVDAHRSLALIISAYNRPGPADHQFHDTVSVVRTIEELLGIAPMNQLDATARPVDIFRSEADLTPYQAVLPAVDPENLITPEKPLTPAAFYWTRRTSNLDLAHEDMADPHILNGAIWFSVRGDQTVPRNPLRP